MLTEIRDRKIREMIEEEILYCDLNPLPVHWQVNRVLEQLRIAAGRDLEKQA